MKKKLVIGLIAVSVLCVSLSAVTRISASESKISAENYYTQTDHIQIIDTSDINAWQIIESRNGNIIIEKVIGIVDDAETGAGHQLDNADYYISYNSVDNIRKGNIICTYFIYNPETNYADDIICRFDYIIDSMAVE